MKKTLILAALVVAGFAANAASFKWSAANIYASNGTDKYSGTVTLYATGITDALSTVTAANGAVPATTFSNDALVAGNSYEFYFVLEDGDNTFTSAVVAKSAQATSTVNIAFGNMTSQTQNASNWSGSAVPEPTSGLLMLLGMAGLALRRRRA